MPYVRDQKHKKHQAEKKYCRLLYDQGCQDRDDRQQCKKHRHDQMDEPLMLKKLYLDQHFLAKVVPFLYIFLSLSSTPIKF